ncbi:MAG TPA: dienelactone hydrolase family protein [Casimicrobiaceae bacterium]|nr:dienelactone hydrolase family protein [Casimicrobiaceae bacterium]
MSSAEPLSETVDLMPGVKGYLAKPATEPAPGVIVLMEAYGLNDFVRRVCNQFAKQGYAAIAPDIYHGDTFAYSDREGAIARIGKVDDDEVMTEVGRSIDMLAQRGARGGKVAIVGFCMGGRLAFLANAVHGNRLASSVSFYGGGISPANPGKRKPLLDRVADLKAPQLLINGAKDASIAADEIGRIASALAAANKRYSIAVYPDAPHAFATDDRESYREAAAKAAWRTAYAFIAEGFAG